MIQQDPAARVIVAVAAEADDKFIWSRLKILPELVTAGPVAIRVGFFGAEGTRSSRPFMVSRWTTDPDELADLLQKVAARCVCGCYVRTGAVLEEALREARRAPLQAVVIIGDSFYGDLDAALATAKQLREAGTRLFLFQQGRSGPAERAYRELAEATGGGFFQVNPHIEKLAERMPATLEAITQFAIGGTAALEARGDEAASLLLGQMRAADRIATR